MEGDLTAKIFSKNRAVNYFIPGNSESLQSSEKIENFSQEKLKKKKIIKVKRVLSD